MLGGTNKLTSQIIINPKSVVFVSKMGFSEDESLMKFRDEKNNGYGEFKI